MCIKWVFFKYGKLLCGLHGWDRIRPTFAVNVSMFSFRKWMASKIWAGMEDRTTSRLGSVLKLDATWIIVSKWMKNMSLFSCRSSFQVNNTIKLPFFRTIINYIWTNVYFVAHLKSLTLLTCRNITQVDMGRYTRWIYYWVLLFYQTTAYGPILVSVVVLTDQVLPLWVQVRLVGQTALHDVGTVAGARFDRGYAAAVRAINQLHQGFYTFWTERDLRKVGKEEGSKGKPE